MASLIEYKGYHGTVEYSKEDDMLVGRVVGVCDVLAYHGNSVQEIQSTFQSCIDGYLEMCEEFGRKPDKEYRGSFNVRITPELHRDAVLAAEASGISLNQFVQEAIDEKLNPKPVSAQLVYVQQENYPFAVSGGSTLRSALYKAPVPLDVQ